MIRFAALLAVSLALAGCGPTGTILYCIAVDNVASKKCQ